MSTTPTTDHHHNLFTWLNHIKHHYDTKKPVITTPLPNSLDQLSKVSSAINDSDGNSFTTTANNDSFHSRKSQTPSMFSKHFKDNLVHFHRPHGLLFHRRHPENNSTSCNCSDTTQHQRHLSTSTNDGDDEQTEDDDNVRLKSDSGISSRENSVFALPDDVDSPDIGFKRIREDGDLVDYDDISSSVLMEECQDARSIEIQAHSRSVIRNDLIRLALNRPFQSPLNAEQKNQVLHVGCGNGAWDMDMASLFPNWLILGIDDAKGGPIQDQRKVPKNFKYIRCYYDLLRTLKDVPSNSFDLVFVRFLIFSYTDESYMQLIKECERICKPGGYVEFYELDMRIHGNPKAAPMTHRLNAKVFKTMEAHCLNPRMARKLGDMVSDVFHAQEPLDSVHSRKNKRMHFFTNYTSLPLGVWGGLLGVMFRDDINDLFEYFEINRDELMDDTIDVQISEESEDDDNALYYKDIETMDDEMETQKAFMNLYHVYARKCLSAEEE